MLAVLLWSYVRWFDGYEPDVCCIQVGIPSSWCDLEHWPSSERAAFDAAKAAGERMAAPQRLAPEDAASALLAMRSRLAFMLDTEAMVASA